MADTESGEVLVPGHKSSTLHATDDVVARAAEHFQKQFQGFTEPGHTQQVDWSQMDKQSHDYKQWGLPDTGVFEGLKKISAPTPDEIKSAQETAGGEVSSVFAPQDQQTFRSMQDALLAGNAKDFAQAISSLRNDPKRLQAFLDEMNKNFDHVHAGIQAVFDKKSGNVVIYNNGNRGVEIGPNGETTVCKIEHGDDGSVVRGGDVWNVKGDKVLKGMGNAAVNSINAPETICNPDEPVGSPKPDRQYPHFPGEPRDPDRQYPHFPGEPRDPDWPHPRWPREPRDPDRIHTLPWIIKPGEDPYKGFTYFRAL